MTQNSSEVKAVNRFSVELNSLFKFSNEYLFQIEPKLKFLHFIFVFVGHYKFQTSQNNHVCESGSKCKKRSQVKFFVVKVNVIDTTQASLSSYVCLVSSLYVTQVRFKQVSKA